MPKHYPLPIKVKVDVETQTVELSIKISDDMVILKRMSLADWHQVGAQVRDQLRQAGQEN